MNLPVWPVDPTLQIRIRAILWGMVLCVHHQHHHHAHEDEELKHCNANNLNEDEEQIPL